MADDDNKNEVGEVAKAVIVTDILANILTHKAADIDARGNPAPDLKPVEMDDGMRVTSAESGSIVQWVRNGWRWFTGKTENEQAPGPAVDEALRQPDKSCSACRLR